MSDPMDYSQMAPTYGEEQRRTATNDDNNALPYGQYMNSPESTSLSDPGYSGYNAGPYYPLDFSQFLDLDALDSELYPASSTQTLPSPELVLPPPDCFNIVTARPQTSIKVEPDTSPFRLRQTPSFHSSNSVTVSTNTLQDLNLNDLAEHKLEPEEQSLSPSPCPSSNATSYYNSSVSLRSVSREEAVTSAATAATTTRTSSSKPTPPRTTTTTTATTTPSSRTSTRTSTTRKSKGTSSRKRGRKPSSDSDTALRAKQAHSVVERRYRDNLNAKITQLAYALSSAQAQAAVRLHTTRHSPSHHSHTTSLFGPAGIPHDASGKMKKSDVMTEALNYIHQTQVEMGHMVEEIGLLRERVRILESFVGWENYEVLQELDAQGLQQGQPQRSFQY